VFTGLIEDIGVVENMEPAGDGKYLTIRSRVAGGSAEGDSICVDGACQTVTALGKDTFTVFVSRVTLSVTTLGGFRPGRRVNLERALTPASRMGGHIVQGHVDGKGVIRNLLRGGNGVEMEITVPGGFMKYIVGKGSIAVDGVSLTVVSVGDGSFKLYLIPETTARTVLNEKKEGDEVNVETDILAKYVEQILPGRKSGEGAADESGLKEKLFEGGYL
jgi:riboflavin synthase